MIRNFCIMAHIDHGKSTLADRLLEATGTVTQREMKEQLLDDMELERARGITIKARAVSMQYRQGDQVYRLNLIDTPGHVDFHYEVSRSLSCCEGALLLVDAFQGVEAQTVANAFAAMEHDLTIIPVINKIDLAQARIEEVIEEMEHSLGIEPRGSAAGQRQDGCGHRPVAAGDCRAGAAAQGRSRARRCRRWCSIRTTTPSAVPSPTCGVMNGAVRKGDKIRLLRAGTNHEVVELGQFTPSRRPCESLVGRPGGLPDLQHQVAGSGPHRRHGLPCRRHVRRAAARLQAPEADGLLRPVSLRRSGLRRTARRAEPAGDQRSQF